MPSLARPSIMASAAALAMPVGLSRVVDLSSGSSPQDVICITKPSTFCIQHCYVNASWAVCMAQADIPVYMSRQCCK